MSQRLDYYTTSPDLSKKLFELSQAVKKSSLGDTLLDLVNIRASQYANRSEAVGAVHARQRFVGDL
jgi:hypothetical protein